MASPPPDGIRPGDGARRRRDRGAGLLLVICGVVVVIVETPSLLVLLGLLFLGVGVYALRPGSPPALPEPREAGLGPA